MKFESIFVSVLLSGLCAAQANSKQHDLTVQIDNIKKNKGQIKVGLYNSDNGFLVDGKEMRSKTALVKSNLVKLEFKNLPQGNYAIAVYHDENMDDVFNTNMIGIPKESYGFSTNYKPLLSKPKFDKVKIELNSDKTVNINLIH